VISGVPIWLRRRPLAIAFGPALELAPGEPPQAFTTRLQERCYNLTREAEQALDAAQLATPRRGFPKEQPVAGTGVAAPRG
jgi:hypothetical protein